MQSPWPLPYRYRFQFSAMNNMEQLVSLPHKFVEFQIKPKRSTVTLSCFTLSWVTILFPLGVVEKQWNLLLSNEEDAMLAFTSFSDPETFGIQIFQMEFLLPSTYTVHSNQMDLLRFCFMSILNPLKFTSFVLLSCCLPVLPAVTVGLVMFVPCL